MRRFGTATLLSVLLHVGIVALAFVTWTHQTPKTLTSSVPVTIISDMPTFEQAAAPVDELAVKPPEPEPAPEVMPEPAPPTPAPKQPVPKPEVAKAPTPQPKPAPKAPEVSKDGLKKPQDTKKPAQKAPAKPAPKALDLDFLAKSPSSPSKAPTRAPARANTRATDGASNAGSSPADTGPAMNALTARLQRLWSPNCDVPGGNQVEIDIGFTLSPGGRVVKGPEWLDRRSDPVWQAGASRAIAAVSRGQPYGDLPDGLYNRALIITFDAKTFCASR
ncbi:hypothetical protein [Asticcacaulis machinosus]|uniref:Cell division and transport-associated protein TolA n=1 Tax=Asticcacaulis machinosus TaxID=2984211 RepID=A0ABT5HMT2_9CAUL|nr:hypothetical protein [Asticcacaulis machinosus]MDC7677556.1 hypothetical protein [Asticcacaulis machinosus]